MYVYELCNELHWEKNLLVNSQTRFMNNLSSPIVLGWCGIVFLEPLEQFFRRFERARATEAVAVRR